MKINNYIPSLQTKLVVPGAVPHVTIYTRLEGPDSLCTINDVIRIEHELEG